MNDENDTDMSTPMSTPENDDHHDTDSAETWETEMTSAFDRRVRDLHEAPLTLDHVKGKAVNIQRKRRVAVAGGILAAAAVVTPVAILATDGLNDSKGEAPIASSSPTVTDDSNPTTPPPVVVTGPAYIQGKTWHQADGSTVTLPTAGYLDVVQLGDYVVAYRQDDQGNGSVDVLDNGGITGTYETYAPFVVNPAGDLVAFVRTDGALVTLGATGDTTPLADGYDALDSRVTALGGTAESPVAYVTTSGNPNVVTAVSVGDREPVDGYTVKSVSADGEVVVQTDTTDFGSCSGIFTDVDKPAVLTTCDYLFEEISPSGDYILATDAYGDGIGLGYFVILDRDLKEIARFEPTGGGFVNRIGWVDDDTVAGTVFDYEAQEWSIGTLDADGTQTDDVVGPVAGEDYLPSYVLQG